MQSDIAINGVLRGSGDKVLVEYGQGMTKNDNRAFIAGHGGYADNLCVLAIYLVTLRNSVVDEVSLCLHGIALVSWLTWLYGGVT